MSDTSQGPGWWKASDGKWYPPQSPTIEAPAPMTAPAAKEPRRWRTWQVAAVGLVALLAGAAIGGAGGVDQTQLTAAEAKADAATEDAEDLEADLSKMRSERDQAKKDAEFAEAEARRKIEAENGEAEAALAARSQELDQAAAALSEREKRVSGAEAAKRAAEFGDGVHEVGVDIQPGKYKANPTSSCYYEKTAKNGDIIDNDNVTGSVTVIIEPSVFTFKSTRCGTWTKTG